MAPRSLIAAALAVALGAGAGVAFLVLSGDEQTPPPRPVRTIVQPPIRVPGGVGAATFFERPATLFGDTVSAHLEIVVDRRYVDPGTVRVKADFEPYRFTAPPVRERSAGGDLVWLKYHYRLLCLRRTCRPRPTRARTFDFTDLRIAFRYTDGARRTVRRGWPPLIVSSRLKRDDLLRGGFRARQHPLPPVSYGIAPDRLSGALAAGAALAFLVGAALVWIALAPVVRSRLRRARELEELERELAALLASLDGGEPDRRTALDRLSRALRRSGAVDLALDARYLAWSAGAPAPGDVRTLASAVEGRIGGAE